MTEPDFTFLERLYFKAKRLRKSILMETDIFKKEELEKELYYLDPVNALIDRIPQRIKPWNEKIDEVRVEVLKQTKGIVTLPDDVIVQILLTAAK